MTLGHYGVALAAKKLLPRSSLATLFLAAQLLDLLAYLFLVLGVETIADAPGRGAVPFHFVQIGWSHSLLAAAFWAAAFGFLYRNRVRGAGWIFMTGLVFSHWVLDAVAHRGDLAAVPGGARGIGLGLYDSRFATIFTESVLFIAGAALYLKATPPTSSRRAIAALFVFLPMIYVLSLFPPPISRGPVLFGAFLQVVAIVWAGRAESQRG